MAILQIRDIDDRVYDRLRRISQQGCGVFDPRQNKSIMDIFGEIKSRLELQGNIIDDMDILIAATALHNNLILITNNTSHFSRIEDLRIENWVSGESRTWA